MLLFDLTPREETGSRNTIAGLLELRSIASILSERFRGGLWFLWKKSQNEFVARLFRLPKTPGTEWM
jgi:hypothetical protein